MSRPPVDTATKLLLKAQSTSSEAEAMALIARCYELLAQILNAYDERNPVNEPRRRERRQRVDRRRAPKEPEMRSAERSAATRRVPRSIARFNGPEAEGEHPWGTAVDVSL